MMTSYYLVEFFIIQTDPNNRTIEIDVELVQSCVGDKVIKIVPWTNCVDWRSFQRNCRLFYDFEIGTNILRIDDGLPSTKKTSDKLITNRLRG